MFGVLSWLVAGLVALAALVAADTANRAAWAGVAILLVAGTLALSAALTRVPGLPAVAGFGVVVATVLAGTRFVSVAWPASTMVLVAAVLAAVAVLVASVTRPVIPASVRLGPAIAAMATGGVLAIGLTGLTLVAAADTVEHAVPLWHAALTGSGRFDWQLLGAWGLTALAVGAVLPGLGADRWARVDVLVVAGSLTVLALPGAVLPPWWAPSLVDTLAVAALAVLAALAPTPRRALAPGIAAAMLTGHAVLASLARPANTAAVLGALVGVGVGAAALSRRDVTSAARRAVGGAALLIGLLALAPAVGAALVAGHLPAWWVARLT